MKYIKFNQKYIYYLKEKKNKHFFIFYYFFNKYINYTEICKKIF